MIQELNRIRRSLDGLVSTIGTDRNSLVADILARVVHEQLHKFQQKAAVGLQDSVSDLMESFKLRVADLIFAAQDAWQDAQAEPTLFPPNCRYLLSRGQSTVVIVEHQPGLRSLKLDLALSDPTRPMDSCGQTQLFSLAFPYSIFVIAFSSGSIKSLYTGWRTEPIRSLDDMLGTPCLPNLHKNLSVCTGYESAYPEDLAATCSEAISRYWSSSFNTDLAWAWWDKEAIHPALKSAQSWAEASQDDPLFVLDLDLQYSTTLQGVIDKVFQDDHAPDFIQMRKLLSEQIDECSQVVFDGLMRYFKRIKSERHYPKDITDQVAGALSSVAEEVMHLAGRMDEKLDKLALEADRSFKTRANQGWERRGVFWSQSKD